MPADATVVSGHDLLTDESLLTGESAPVHKIAAANAETGGPARRRRPALRLFRQSRRARPRPRDRDGDRPAQRNRQDRRGDHGDRSRAAAIAGGDGTAGQAVRGDQPQRQRARGAALRDVARALVRCGAERHRARHVDAAGGDSARPDRVHGDGRLAHLAGPRAHPPHLGDRIARRRDRAVHRQDRHADPEPHDDRRAARRDKAIGGRKSGRIFSAGGGGAARLRRAGERARTVRSDGEGVLRAARDDARRRRRPASRPDARTRVWRPPRPVRRRQCLARPRRGRALRRRKARRRRSPNCAALAAPERERLGRLVDEMARDGMRVLAVARAALAAGLRARRLAARPAVHASGSGRARRPAARQRAGRGQGMPLGRGARGDDHRRLSRHRARHRRRGRNRRDRDRHRAGHRGDGRRRTGAARPRSRRCSPAPRRSTSCASSTR